VPRGLIPLILLFLALAAVPASACFVIYDRDILRPMDELRQFSAISYQDGRENLLYSIDIDSNAAASARQLTWLFPIPAPAESARIDIMRAFPWFTGVPVDAAVDRELKDAFAAMRGMQIYPLPFAVVFMPAVFGAAGAGDVQVRERVSRYGLTTELVGAKDAAALEAYLGQRGVSLPAGARALLDDYLGKEYSFVVSWISDLPAFRNATQEDAAGPGWRGYDPARLVSVFVSFPTDRIFYPLKLNQLAGDARIPALIYVAGHVTPERSPGAAAANVTYFTNGAIRLGEASDVPALQRFFQQDASLTQMDFLKHVRSGSLKYTKIAIEAPASALNDDLWMRPGAPLPVRLKDAVAHLPFAAWFALFLLLSGLASLAAGMLAFRGQVGRRKLFLWGAWNALTLLGFGIATAFALKDEAARGRKFRFVLLFTLLFLLLTFGIQRLLQALF
jgi:hypothetical protein